MLSIPPFRSSSSLSLPVLMYRIYFLCSKMSSPLVKPRFSSFIAASIIFSNLASVIPFTLAMFFFTSMMIDLTVQYPSFFSQVISCIPMPSSSRASIGLALYCSLSSSNSSCFSSTSSTSSTFYFFFCII